MSIAFGDVRTIPASKTAKNIMKQLENKKIFDEQRDVWRLGASLGISLNQVHEGEKRDTFQNINSLDPDQVLAAIMLGLYPTMEPEDRVKKLVDHAEWGIREINRKVKIDTLDFSTIGIPDKEAKTKIDLEPKIESVEELIKKGESVNLEYKSSLRWDIDNNRLLEELSYASLKTIVGFLNSKDGGTLLIGVNPDGIILGLENDYSTLKPKNKDGFEQLLMSKISSNIGMTFATEVTLEFVTCENKEICRVNVPPGLQPAYLTEKGKQPTFYVRVGNSTKPLNVEEATKYCVKRFKL